MDTRDINNEKPYQLGGAAALAAALLNLVAAFVGFARSGQNDTIVDGLLFSVGIVLSIYAMLVLKQFLNEKLMSKKSDGVILWFIIANAVLGFIGVVGSNQLPKPEAFNNAESLQAAIGTLAIIWVLIALLGVVYILLGRDMMAWANVSQGNLRTFGILNMVSGILMVTLIGVIVAIVLQAVAWIFLALVLFKPTLSTDE